MKLATRIALVVIVVGGLFLILRPRPNENPNPSLDFLLTDELVTYFVDQLEEPVIEEVGQPIEGFTPVMLTSYYPELKLEDFAGAEALQGRYVYSSGRLEFVFEEEAIPHSAADTLTSQGMKTVLSNLGKRYDMVIDTEPEIDSLIESLQSNS